MQYTEDKDIDKLLHELDIDPHDLPDEAVQVDAIDAADDCFVCGLVQYVKDIAYDYALGPALCVAQRLEREHFEDGACLHRIESVQRRIAEHEATHREQMIRLQRATDFHESEAQRLEAELARVNEELRRRGIRP